MRANAYPPSIPSLIFGESAQSLMVKTKGPKDYGAETTCVVAVPDAKKGDVESELKTRQKINVDPFQNGFQHSSFSLNSVRLCFQVIPTVPRAPIDIPPTVSEVIRHDKSNGELSIVHFSHNKSTMDGGKKIMLLLNAKVSRSVELHFKFLNHSE